MEEEIKLEHPKVEVASSVFDKEFLADLNNIASEVKKGFKV